MSRAGQVWRYRAIHLGEEARRLHPPRYVVIVGPTVNWRHPIVFLDSGERSGIDEDALLASWTRVT